MPTLDDVRRIATSLPEVEDHGVGGDGWLGWSVRKKNFVWERPLRERDVRDLEGAGERVPGGDLVAVRIDGVDSKPEALSIEGVFEVPHFANYPAVLVELSRVGMDDLEDLIRDAWVVQAPKRLSKAFLESR
jgi:hypothetical protein